MKGIFQFRRICALFILLLAAGCGQQDNVRPTEPAEHLDPQSVPLYKASQKAEAKDFTIEQVNGEEFTLSDHTGQVIILNIWATWCAPCRTETPELDELYRDYKDEGLLVLGVSIDKQGKAVVKPFMEEYDVSYPMVIDDGRIMDKYGPTMAIPTTYIIDRNGELRYFATGAVTRKELEPRIKKLLGNV